MPETGEPKHGLTETAYHVGFEYEQKYGGCAQCCFAALQVALGRRGPDADAAFRALSAMAGGVAGMGDGSCGAYLGAVAFVGYLVGRERDKVAAPGVGQADPEVRSRKYGENCGQADAMAMALYHKFIERYGTTVCHQIHRKLYGRPFFNKDPQEYEKFKAAGAYDQGCTVVVGESARWTVEILTEVGVI